MLRDTRIADHRALLQVGGIHLQVTQLHLLVSLHVGALLSILIIFSPFCTLFFRFPVFSEILFFFLVE